MARFSGGQKVGGAITAVAVAAAIAAGILGNAVLEDVAAGGSGDLLRDDGDGSGLSGVATAGALATVVTDAKYQVPGTSPVWDGTRWLQGISDDMLTDVDTSIWTASYDDEPNMTITAGAAGTTFDATAAAATGFQRLIWTPNESLRELPVLIRWHSTFQNYGNETSAGLEIVNDSSFIVVMHRRLASTTVAVSINGSFGSSASPGDATWICTYYNPQSGRLDSYYNNTNGATDDPGWPHSSSNWSSFDSRTVSYGGRPKGAIRFQMYLYQNHAAQATVLMRGRTDGIIRLAR